MSDERLVKWLKGHSEAIAFIEDIHRIVELWDDLIDRDREPRPAEIHAAFTAALIGLPRNRFYMANFGLLSPILENAIDNWHVANALEHKGGEALQTSFILRCGILDMTTMAAKIIGGPEWALTVGIEMRQAGGDSFQKYAAEHGAD